MIDINRLVRTRDGREVIGLRLRGGRVHGVLINPSGILYQVVWKPNGRSSRKPDRMDLINIDPPGWPQS